MGTLIYFVNHTKKQYFSPVAKISEIYCNRIIMCGIIYVLRNYWNNCKIEIISEYELDKIPKDYKEIPFDLNDYIDF